MAGAVKPPHKSREGTYEVLLKSALEDTSLSDHARSLLFFAVTKPECNRKGERWVLSETALARDMNRAPDCIRLALRELRRAGYAAVVTERDAGGRVKRRTTVLNREKLIVPRSEPDRVPAGQNLKVGYPPGGYLPPIESTVKSSEYCSVLSIERTKELPHDSHFASLRANVRVFPAGEEDHRPGPGLLAPRSGGLANPA